MLHRTPLPAAFSLLLTIYSLLIVSSLPSCKNSIVPPERLPTGPDTTSHEFIWQIDTIGAEGILYDVAIVNDTLIYAVGEIYLRDAAGQIDPQAYCVAVWNGASWALKRVHSFSNQLIPSVRGVLAFTPTDIWLADGGVHQWDGFSSRANQSFGRIELIGGSENGQSVDKLWGTGPTDLYGVGRVGMITHFNGSSWQKIESGKAGTFRFADVWGSARGGAFFVVAVGSNFSGDHAVKAITPTSATDSLGWLFDASPATVWFSSDSPIYIGGFGLRRYVNAWEELDTVRNFNRVRGNSSNDVFAWGGLTETSLLHYNGSTWYEYREISIAQGFRTGLAIRGDVVVATGFVGDQCYVIRGYR